MAASYKNNVTQITSGVFMRTASLIFILVSLLPAYSHAFEIEQFEVLGAKVGDQAEALEPNLKPLFPPVEQAQAEHPDSKFANYFPYDCRDYGRNYGCEARASEYNRGNNQLIRIEHLSLGFTPSKKLHQVTHSLITRVANDYETCKGEVAKYRQKLVSQVGKPTYTYDRQPIRVGRESDHYGLSLNWVDSTNADDMVFLSLGCTEGGKFLKELSIQAPSVANAEKPKTVTGTIR